MKIWPKLIVIRDGAPAFTRNSILSLIKGKILKFKSVTQVLVEDEETGEEFEVRADSVGKLPLETSEEQQQDQINK